MVILAKLSIVEGGRTQKNVSAEPPAHHMSNGRLLQQMYCNEQNLNPIAEHLLSVSLTISPSKMYCDISKHFFLF